MALNPNGTKVIIRLNEELLFIMRKNIRSLALLPILLIWGCHNNLTYIEKKLNKVKSSQQEKIVFKKIYSHLGNELCFIVLDDKDKKIDISKPNWWTNAKKIRFFSEDKHFDYVIINNANLGVLMME